MDDQNKNLILATALSFLGDPDLVRSVPAARSNPSADPARPVGASEAAR